MFVLVQTKIDDDCDEYDLVGTYNTFDEARHAMWEASDYVFDKYDYNTREVNESELCCVVFYEDAPRSYCTRLVIFDSDNPATFTF